MMNNVDDYDDYIWNVSQTWAWYLDKKKITRRFSSWTGTNSFNLHSSQFLATCLEKKQQHSTTRQWTVTFVETMFFLYKEIILKWKIYTNLKWSKGRVLFYSWMAHNEKMMGWMNGMRMNNWIAVTLYVTFQYRVFKFQNWWVKHIFFLSIFVKLSINEMESAWNWFNIGRDGN